MLIVHLADIHLRRGASRFHVYDQTIANLLAKVDTIAGEKMFVVCGDVLHDRNSLDAFVVQLFSSLVRGLESRGRVIIIQGNHDHHPHHGDAVAPHDILGALVRALDLPGVIYMDESGGAEVDGVFFGTVTIHDANEAGDVRANALKADLPKFPAPRPTAKCSVALWHGGLSSCRYGNLSVKSKGVSLQWFAGYDLALLGDIHLQQIGNHVNRTDGDGRTTMGFSDSATTWGYPGSLVQQDHGEQLWGHGFLLWDLEARTVEAHHVACPEGYVTLRGGELFYDQRWTPLEKHLADPDFPRALRIRSVGRDADADAAAATLLNDNGVSAASLSKLHAAEGSQRQRQLAVDASDYVQEGGCTSLLEKHGLSVEAIIANSALQKFSNGALDRMREDRGAKLDKLLTRFREIKGVNDTVLTLGAMRWSWILSFRDGNETRAFLDEGLTTLHAPNGTGKTALLETLFLALYGEGFPSRTTKDDSASFINDEKPAAELAQTELDFAIGRHQYTVVRRWNRAGDKAVVKEVTLRKAGGGGGEAMVVLCKGRAEVDRWVAKNVCQGTDFLAGIMMTQGNDSDFLSMSARDQCAMINRAFGLDALDALYDYLHETRNSMNYLINQVPELPADAGDAQDAAALKQLLDERLETERGAKRGLEQLPPPAATPTAAEYEAALADDDGEGDATSAGASVLKIEAKLATLRSITLPCLRVTGAPSFAGTFGDAKRVVDAQVRLEAATRRHGFDVADLRATRDRDLAGMAGGASTAEERAELVAAERSAASVQASLKAKRLQLRRLAADIAGNEGDLRSSLDAERTLVSRVLSQSGQRLRAGWASAAPPARAALVLEYATSVAPGLLPDATAMLREAFTPVAGFWDQDFDACASALQMSLPEAARAVRVRELPPSSEIMATLNAQKERSSKLSTEVGVAEAEAAQLAEAVADLVARVAHAESGAERVGECKRRVEALTVMEACLEEIAGASVAGAKFKFEQEKARLQERLEELRRRARSRATVATHDAETERDRLKRVLESLDLIALSKRVGIAEARNAWRDDVPVVAEYRRRLGHVLQALSLLKDIKDNVYSEYVLPELCRRVNATIAAVDGNVAVQAVMDPGGIIKWYSVDAGSRVRIKRASGFQQFIVAMGIRVELGTMIRPCRTALIDEGFTACDAQHIQRIPDFLQSLITSGRFDTVLIVTHIEALQNGVSNTLSMRRGERMCA